MRKLLGEEKLIIDIGNTLSPERHLKTDSMIMRIMANKVICHRNRNSMFTARTRVPGTIIGSIRYINKESGECGNRGPMGCVEKYH